MSVDILIEKIKKTKNPSVAGLDAKLDFIPAHIIKENITQYGETLKAAAMSMYAFNRGLIDALYDIVPAIKPQSAYYELLGSEGVFVLQKTIEYAKTRGMYVIADVKRGDIGPTAQSYADAYLGTTAIGDTRIAAFGADSMTVNPYLGSDGISPFLKACREHKRSIFILAKTSNPSSHEFQDLLIDGEPFWQRVAEKIGEWGAEFMGISGYSNVGAVVGATYKQEQKRMRQLLKNAYFLVPGYGAQGAAAADIADAFNDDGLGAIVNSSRGIMCAWQKAGDDGLRYDHFTREEAIRMRDEITGYIR